MHHHQLHLELELEAEAPMTTVSSGTNLPKASISTISLGLFDPLLKESYPWMITIAIKITLILKVKERGPSIIWTASRRGLILTPTSCRKSET